MRSKRIAIGVFCLVFVSIFFMSSASRAALERLYFNVYTTAYSSGSKVVSFDIKVTDSNDLRGPAAVTSLSIATPAGTGIAATNYAVSPRVLGTSSIKNLVPSYRPLISDQPGQFPPGRTLQPPWAGG